MKTIEQAAKLHTQNKVEGKHYGDGSRASIAEKAFIEGVCFAQRWIDFKDETPSNEDMNILVKSSCKRHNGENVIHATDYLHFRNCFDIKKYTHWRPIELK